MHTKQLLKSKLNLYCIHFPFLSRDWTSLDPHSFKFHASPLNPAYQKRLLSGFPPCALRWGFETEIKAAASVAGKKTPDPWLCPSVCVFGAWYSRFGISLPGAPNSYSLLWTREWNCAFVWHEECCWVKAICQACSWGDSHWWHPQQWVWVSLVYLIYHHQILPHIAPRIGGERPDSCHLQTKGENPARPEQRREPRRRQLLFKWLLASGALSRAFVLKTQLETQAWAAEQMDSSCSVCLHLPNELLPRAAELSKCSRKQKEPACWLLVGSWRDGDGFWGGREKDWRLQPSMELVGNPSEAPTEPLQAAPNSFSCALGWAQLLHCPVSHQAAGSQPKSAHPQSSTLPPKKSGSQTAVGSSCQHFDASPGPAEGGFVISLIGPGLQFILAINYRNVVGLAFSNQIRFFSQESLAGSEIAALLQCVELQILLAPANRTALCIDNWG